MDQIREHGIKLLPFPAVDFIRAQMPRAPLRAALVPGLEKRALGPARFAPTHPMADGSVARGHRLTIEPDDLPQPSRDPRLRVRERDPLGTNATDPTAHAALPIDHGDAVGGPRQVIPP